MLGEEFEGQWGLGAPLNDEDYAQFGLEQISLDQINQGDFFVPEGFCLEEMPFEEPDVQGVNNADGSG